MATETRAHLYGLMAEFDEPEPLLEAARRAHAEGYRQMDAYSPMPVEGLAEAIGFRSSMVQRIWSFARACWAPPADLHCAGG